MNFEKLITKHVQKLVPYLSARRIGGHGHNFLNANESPKSEGYFLNSSSLNRYPDCQPEDLVERFADYAKRSTKSSGWQSGYVLSVSKKRKAF